MYEVTIRNYIGYHKELTAEQVRKLAPGTHVIKHHFDRRGEHQELDMWVVKAGNGRMLAFRDVDGMTETRKIVKETDRMCYTEAERGGEYGR